MGQHERNGGSTSAEFTSDLGKSSFLRQFALSIALKERSFLGNPLNVHYGRAIYLVTEDSKTTVQLSLVNCVDSNTIKASQLKDLCYLINPDNPLRAIEEQLKIAKADVVIIDSFADVFNGNLNDIVTVRTSLNNFQRLSEKYDTLFIFLHHTGKRTEHNTPSKNNIIGSQGFEAKMRLVMELRKVDSSQKRFLHFTKGNYLSESVKSKSLELLFDNNQQFSLIGNISVADRNERVFSENQKEIIIKHGMKLKEQGYSYENILVKLKEIKEIKKVPSKGTLVKLLEKKKSVNH